MRVKEPGLSLVLILTVILALAGAQTNSRQAGKLMSSKMTLASCGLPGVQGEVRCGTYSVWEDRAAKSGRKIDLHVAVIPARGAKPAPDPLFIIPGGPGQGAMALAPHLLKLFDKVNQDRDIVLIDQRGTGKSNPLNCDLGTGIDAVMSTDFPQERLKACRQELERRADLRLYTTPIAMDDLDEVREALGYERINLFGGSYGSRAALVYMRQYPQRVRSALLTSATPTYLNIPVDGTLAAQRALNGLFEDCAANPACSAAYPRLEQELDEVLARLSESPVTRQVSDPTSGKAAEVKITRDLFAATALIALYSPDFTRNLPLIIHRAHAGDFSPFLTFAVPVRLSILGQISLGMHFSVVVAEDVPRITAEQVKKIKGTFLGDVAVRGLAQVAEVWPRGALPPRYHEPVSSSAPVLILSGELDPATEPAWGKEVARHLPHARQIVLPATGHLAIFPSAVSDLIAEFMTTATVPAHDPAGLSEMRRPPFVVPGPPASK